MDAVRARASIEALLGEDARGDALTTEVSVQIEGNAQTGYRAELEIERGDEAGERALRGARCDEVSAAATLVIAMVIDPSAAERVPAAEPAPASLGAPLANEPAEPLRIALGAKLLGDVGSLPRATLGAGIALGLHFTARLRIELAALALLPQRAVGGPTATSSTLLALYAGQLRACFAPFDALANVMAFEGCAAAELGISRGDPRGISNGGPSSGVWGAGFVGLGLRQASRNGLQVGALIELGLPIFRPVYEIDGYGPVFRATPVLARLSLEARWLFP
jgi:hypothetical protein